MNSTSFSDLRNCLIQLKEEAGLVALKTGTEIEDMGFEEIAYLRKLSRNIIPLYVKIGGAEARNDIRSLSELKVDALIAPMIESPYALQKFFISLREVLNPNDYKRIQKAINIETITAVEKLEEILQLPEAGELDQITAARTDLSGSMAAFINSTHLMNKNNENKNIKISFSPNDDAVLTNCKLIVSEAQKHKIRTSVGGKIEPASLEAILTYIKPDLLNSRHMVLSTQVLAEGFPENSHSLLIQNLQFECFLYSNLAQVFPMKKTYYSQRGRILQERILTPLFSLQKK